MSMKVQCPSCHTELRVPVNASGRTARCPVCRHKFQVPNPQDLLEDAVSQWIVEDPDDDEEKDDAPPAPTGVRPQPMGKALPGLPGQPAPAASPTVGSGASGAATAGSGLLGAPPGLPGLPGRPATTGPAAARTAAQPQSPAAASGGAARTPASPRPVASAQATPAAPPAPGRPMTPVQADSGVALPSASPVDRPEVPAQPGSDDDEIALVQRQDAPTRRTDASGRSPIEPLPPLAPQPPRTTAVARATTAAASASSDDTAEIDLSLEPSENDAATAEDPSNETTEMISPTAAADRAVVEPPAEKSPAPVAHAAPAPATPAPPAAAPFDRSAPSTAPARPASAEPVAAAASPAPPVPALDIVFPAGLQVTGHPPHLAVVSCNQEGVLFAFDAGFLEHMGFRRSMPQRCAMSGQAQKADLIARPLAFVDRAKTPVRSPREVEIHHEVQLDAHRSPADVLHAMGQLEQLPAPFNRPLPYYVATGHSLASLSCSTINRADGGVTCRVLIPDGQTALEWLMRVNGVCGPEHPLLEHAVGMLWSDAWRELPDKVRHRLSAWCGFEPMESFRVYLPDADFAKQDLGLAGVVITDRRLIHCKFNHKGQAPLDAEAVLRVQPEGEFVNLTLQTVVERVKVAKLSLADLPALVRGLRDAKGLTLQMGGRE